MFEEEVWQYENVGFMMRASNFPYILSVRDKSFESLYPAVIQDLSENDEQLSAAINHLDKVMQYNIFNRNYTLAFPTHAAYKMLAPAEYHTVDNLRLTNILDWCVEMTTTAYFMADDISDASEMRWNRECWYRNDMGKTAVSDIKLMHSSAHKLMRKHFTGKPYYSLLMHLLTKTTYHCLKGQMIDNYTSSMFKKDRDISVFTLNTYGASAYGKTTSFACRFPVYATMLLADISHKQVGGFLDSIIYNLGYMSTLQNDVWDCYGDTDKKGKDGNDISEVRDPSFKKFYSEVIHDLRVDDGAIAEVNSHVEEVFRHNVLNRSFYVVFPVLTSYKLLAPKEHQTSDNLRLANILDWCLETALGSYTMADDILDGTETRWNQECWYRTDMGKSAINDIQLMQIAVYKLLHNNFIDKPYYNNLTHLFTNSFYNAYLGQMFDNDINRMFQRNRDISAFTMNKYKASTDYRVIDIGYTLPVHAAMMLADVLPKEQEKPIYRVLQGLAYLVQVQNDTLDWYGDVDKHGKEGTDIREGKMTWVIVKALEDANEKQTEILANNYGKDEDKCIKTVINVYDELRMLDKYRVHNQEVIDDIKNNISSIPNEAIRKVLHVCLDTHISIDRNILD